LSCPNKTKDDMIMNDNAYFDTRNKAIDHPKRKKKLM